MVDRGHAQLDRIEVLISDIYTCKEVGEDRVTPLWAAAHAIGETLAAYKGLCQLVLIIPGAVVQ